MACASADTRQLGKQEHGLITPVGGSQSRTPLNISPQHLYLLRKAPKIQEQALPGSLPKLVSRNLNKQSGGSGKPDCKHLLLALSGLGYLGKPQIQFPQ
jgi:hypothetical protein